MKYILFMGMFAAAFYVFGQTYNGGDNIFNEKIIDKFIQDSYKRDLDGALLSFETEKDCFSFVELYEKGYATRTNKKNPISTHAICGVYYC